MKLTSLQVAVFKRRATMLAIGLGVVVALAFWLLVTPDNPLTDYFSAPITVRDARVIVGPYPRETDFQLLKRNHVDTIVSLLDPKLPFESVLLDRERSLAEQYGMRVLDFPMGSLFNHHIGGDYEAEARLAAIAVEQTPGRVYLHCYLGMHRVGTVEALLAKAGQTTGVYLASHGERSADANLLDQAQNAYDSHNYPLTLRVLLNIVEKSEASQILEGWADYKLGDVKLARANFAAALKFNAQSNGAQDGLGYCALRQDDVDEAALHFSASLDVNAKDPAALTGMGLARYRQGRTADAAHYLRESLAINPDDGDAKAALARIN
jgi:tetratricopeptide (TPR) repeat protein